MAKDSTAQARALVDIEIDGVAVKSNDVFTASAARVSRPRSPSIGPV